MGARGSRPSPGYAGEDLRRHPASLAEFMLVPRPLTPLVRFLAGVSYIPGGAVYLIRNPRLWPVAISPLLVAAVLLMIGIFTGAIWAGRIEQAFFGGSLRTI